MATRLAFFINAFCFIRPWTA